MATWEVFGRRRFEDALEHVGSLHAPDRTTALLLARETHFRHQEGVDYAVVRSDHLHRMADPSLLERVVDISYRTQAGYSGFREKRQTARAAADARGQGHLRDRPTPAAAGREARAEASAPATAQQARAAAEPSAGGTDET
jgi:ring-1,2-phenylacetyl-CoA epoxidase subunit PaaB